VTHYSLLFSHSSVRQRPCVGGGSRAWQRGDFAFLAKTAFANS
jgi:hypothetical protein